VSFITPVNLADDFLTWGVRITFADGTIRDVTCDQCTEVLATRVCEVLLNHWPSPESVDKSLETIETIETVIDALRVRREYTVVTIHGGTDTGIFRATVEDILDGAYEWEEVYDAADKLPGRKYDFGSTFYEDSEEEEVQD